MDCSTLGHAYKRPIGGRGPLHPPKTDVARPQGHYRQNSVHPRGLLGAALGVSSLCQLTTISSIHAIVKAQT